MKKISSLINLSVLFLLITINTIKAAQNAPDVPNQSTIQAKNDIDDKIGESRCWATVATSGLVCLGMASYFASFPGTETINLTIATVSFTAGALTSAIGSAKSCSKYQESVQLALNNNIDTNYVRFCPCSCLPQMT